MARRRRSGPEFPADSQPDPAQFWGRTGDDRTGDLSSTAGSTAPNASSDSTTVPRRGLGVDDAMAARTGSRVGTSATTASSSTVADGATAASTSTASTEPPPKATTRPTRPVPVRSHDFDHLTLAALRAYRRTLTHEESRVSYWRRLIQARLDVLRDDAGPAALAMTDVDKVERLRGVLAEARVGESRQALVSVVPIDDIPPLPDLEDLWSRELRPTDPAHCEAIRRDLSFAELQLSAYRSALHDRLGAATQELIARYREEPALCLSVLPSR